MSFTFTFYSYAGCYVALSPPVSRGKAIARTAYGLLCRILRIKGIEVWAATIKWDSCTLYQRTLRKRESGRITFTRQHWKRLSLGSGGGHVSTLASVPTFLQKTRLDGTKA